MHSVCIEHMYEQGYFNRQLNFQPHAVLSSPVPLQVQTKSWALASHHSKFVVPAIYSQARDCYYTVLQEGQATTGTYQTLLSWPATTTHGSLEQTAERRPLQGAVHSVHTARAVGQSAASGISESSDLIIVFTDSSVSFSTTAGEVLPPRTAGSKVINANVDGNFLAVVCASKAGSDHTLELYSLQVTKVTLAAQPGLTAPVLYHMQPMS